MASKMSLLDQDVLAI